MSLFGLADTLDELDRESRKLDEAIHGVSGKSEKVILQEMVNLERSRQEREYLQTLSPEQREEYLYQKYKKNRWDDWGSFFKYHKMRRQRKNAQREIEISSQPESGKQEAEISHQLKSGIRENSISVHLRSHCKRYFILGLIGICLGFEIGSMKETTVWGILLGILGVALVVRGFSVKSMEKKYRRYLDVMIEEKIFEVNDIAKAVGEDAKVVENTLDKMFSSKYVSGYINKKNHIVHLTKG